MRLRLRLKQLIGTNGVSALRTITRPNRDQKDNVWYTESQQIRQA